MLIVKLNIMRVLSIILVSIVFLSSCSQSNDSVSESVVDNKLYLTAGLNYEQAEAEKLYTGKCMICHGVGTSEETAIAPPMASIKRRYLREFRSKEDFVKGMVSFSENPTDDKAMMFNAMATFNVMPKLGYKKEELVKIAAFIFDTEIIMPDWHENHGGRGEGRSSGRNRSQLSNKPEKKLENTAETLLNSKCVICHQNSEGQTSAIAPPLTELISTYKEKYKTQGEFSSAVLKFVNNPQKENSLMPESIEQYNLMPKLNYATKDVELIAKYLFGTDSEKIEKQLVENKKNIISEKLSPEGVYNARCKICHNIDVPRNELLAAPMVNIKRKYLRVYRSKEDFIEGIVDFTRSPEQGKAMMFGALKEFELMPKLNYSDEELKMAAEYIFYTKFEKPRWCD